MFFKAMIATDLWTDSFPVLKCIKGLKELGIDNFHLLKCVEQAEMPGVNIEVMKNFLQTELDRQKNFLNKRGFNVESEILIGKKTKDINRLATEKNCGLIALGSHGHTRMCELLLGNIAYETISRQSMPILLIRIMSHNKKKSFISEDKYEFLNHVVFPTDFSKNADYASTFLEKIISKGPKLVTLLHIQNKTILSPHLSHRVEEFNKIDTQRLEKLKEKLLKNFKVEINVEIRYGHPVSEIVQFAKSNHASLIIMGSQGRGFLQEVFLGSVSQNVARCSDIPIMLVPAPERNK